jgi:hypothetical protein
MWWLTQRDLEFLTSLQARWRMLYWRELARALAADARSVTLNAGRAPRVIGNPAVDLREWPVWASKPN